MKKLLLASVMCVSVTGVVYAGDGGRGYGQNSNGAESSDTSGKGPRQTGSTLTFYSSGNSRNMSGGWGGGCGCQGPGGLHAGPI